MINSIGEDENSNEYVGLDVNHVTHSLALSLKPFKIINLNPFGGLKDANGKVRIIKFMHKRIAQNSIPRLRYKHFKHHNYLSF